MNIVNINLPKTPGELARAIMARLGLAAIGWLVLLLARNQNMAVNYAWEFVTGALCWDSVVLARGYVVLRKLYRMAERLRYDALSRMDMDHAAKRQSEARMKDGLKKDGLKEGRETGHA